ncbi:hypothetical protein G6F68_016850 [Rhizopus microsporus]|nr:hypothetical protein G6F68_016850 [Rhizopus microsporus]
MPAAATGAPLPAAHRPATAPRQRRGCCPALAHVTAGQVVLRPGQDAIEQGLVIGHQRKEQCIGLPFGGAALIVLAAIDHAPVAAQAAVEQHLPRGPARCRWRRLRLRGTPAEQRHGHGRLQQAPAVQVRGIRHRAPTERPAPAGSPARV